MITDLIIIIQFDIYLLTAFLFLSFIIKTLFSHVIHIKLRYFIITFSSISNGIPSNDVWSTLSIIVIINWLSHDSIFYKQMFSNKIYHFNSFILRFILRDLWLITFYFLHLLYSIYFNFQFTFFQFSFSLLFFQFTLFHFFFSFVYLLCI